MFFVILTIKNNIFISYFIKIQNFKIVGKTTMKESYCPKQELYEFNT